MGGRRVQGERVSTYETTPVDDTKLQDSRGRQKPAYLSTNETGPPYELPDAASPTSESHGVCRKLSGRVGVISTA